MTIRPEDLSEKQRAVLDTLRAANGEPVIVAASTGARLVEKGFAAPAVRPNGTGSIPRGYGSFRAKL